MDTISYVDFDITKTERQADGSVYVYGACTDDSIDSDRQIIDPEFASRGLSKWFGSGANVREMHQPKAIGKGIELVRVGSAHMLKSHIIEPTAAKLADNGVLRAYSVGISSAKIDYTKNPQARGGTIVDGEFVEVSMVDRPANANCKVDLVTKMANGDAHFTDILTGKAEMDEREDCSTCHGDGKIRGNSTDCPDCGGSGKMSAEKLYARSATFAVEGALYKKDYSSEERKEMAEKGHALPDGSYPIADSEDLHNAYTLAASGHGDVGAAKHLIARRAKELGVANPFEKDDAEKVEKKGKLPEDDAKVTEALQEATAAQDDDNAGHMDGDDENDEDAEKSDAPYVLKRLHDHLCAAFTPEAVKSAYPTVAQFGDVIDPHYFAERVTEIIGLDSGTGQYAGDLAKASTAYGLAVNLAKMDEDVAQLAREVIAKTFSDMYPSVHLTPGDIMPGQFRRSYISAGHANQSASAGQKPRLPMNSSTPDAGQFDRGYISDGRAANSPSAMGPNSATSSKISKFDCDAESREVEGMTVFKITHAPTGVVAQGVNEDDAWEKLQEAVKQRNFYTNNARDQAAEVMTGMHDYIVAMHPGICPMASKLEDLGEDATPEDAGTSQVDNRAEETPKEQAGYSKLESADIVKMVESEVEKLMAPLVEKNEALEKRAEEAEARVAELGRLADPEMGVYRGGRGVIPFTPKQDKTDEGPGVRAEVEKQEMVEWCLEKIQSPDQATKRQALERLEELLSPDELAAALVKTG